MAARPRADPLPGPNIRFIYTVKLIALATVLTVGALLKWSVFPAAPIAPMTLVVALSALPIAAVAAWPGEVPATLLAFSLATDVIGITACIHIGGGVEMVSGPMVYLVVVVLAGMLFSERAAFVTAGGGALAYGLAIWAEHQGLLAHHAPYTWAPGRQLSAVFNVTVGLFVAAWVVLYAIRQVRTVYSRAEALRSEAVRALSHDLKNPLGMIQRSVPLVADAAPPERRDHLRQIQAVAQQALGLVRTVLEAVRQVRAIFQRAADMRSEVVSALSHDLKNPLGNIQGYAELAADCPPEELAEYVRGMQRSTQQALDLVRNVLDASAIEARALTAKRQPVDVYAVVAQVIEMYRFAADGKDIRLRGAHETPAHAISADAQMLTRAIGNLLSNAIKYTPSGGHVEVVTAADNDAVTITVRDSGIGIPPEGLSRLFQKYSRTSSGHGVEGTGLGLYIVRRIAEAHGGCVRVASDLGNGSRFTLELPRDDTQAPSLR